MSAAVPASSSEPQARALRYERHRPGQTLLYRIVAQHYPPFVEHMACRGRPLPDYVQQEFESYLKREIKGSGLHYSIKKRLQELISFMLSCTKLVSSMTIK